MLLTVDTSLGDAILARYGGFVYSISDGAQMLLLQHPDAPSPPPPALRIAETVWNIQNCLEQNNLFTLNLNLSFLQRLVAAAAAPAAMLAVRSRMLTERALWTRAPSDGESRVLQTGRPAAAGGRGGGGSARRAPPAGGKDPRGHSAAGSPHARPSGRADFGPARTYGASPGVPRTRVRASPGQNGRKAGRGSGAGRPGA